ncbi:MAG TPA: hypothetical protein VK626_01535 [Nitrospiraceae bacterium]|nr:hypothetical protein [Nitrospiraceae bacterium]
MAVPTVQPINLFQNYLQGRGAAQDEQGANIKNALATQNLGQVTRQNALYEDPNATPEQFVRAGDTQTGNALQGVQDKSQNDKTQAVSQLGAVAQQALSITDPTQRRAFLHNAQNVYAPAFKALGGDPTQALDNIPDDQLTQRLQQVAQFATPKQPIAVAEGASLVAPNGQGGYAPVFQGGGKPLDELTKLNEDHKKGLISDADYAQRRTMMTTRPSETPSGYERDPTTPGAIRPISGGPHDPNAVSGGMDSRSSVMFNRVAASAQAATKAIQNIMELPISTSTGWFGGAQAGTSLLGSVKAVLGQKVTSQEAQDFKTMVAGVSRNLSTIETAGLAPNGAITHSMDAVLLGEGDTQMTKLRKMAEMRQIVEENLKPQLANPKLAPQQKDLIRNIIGGVQQAVPFTHHDITLLQGSKNPQATIQDFATQQGLKTGTPTASAATGPANTGGLDTSKYALAANDPSTNTSNWDKRADGSNKGNGFLGLLKRPDGKVSSEISVGVEIGGKEVEVPTMVPTLSQGELDYLMTHSVDNGTPLPRSIIQKATAFAKQRIAAGKSPFAGANESPGATASPGSQSGPVKVNSPQEAMALPSGTQFVTPDGRVKVRP